MIHLVTAIIRPHKLQEVEDVLRGIGVTGLTVTEVRGYGRQGGKTETYRGSEYRLAFLPKIKVEAVVETADVDKVINAITAAARTDKVGDGKIWAVDVDRLMRIRTGEFGSEAL